VESLFRSVALGEGAILLLEQRGQTLKKRVPIATKARLANCTQTLIELELPSPGVDLQRHREAR